MAQTHTHYYQEAHPTSLEYLERKYQGYYHIGKYTVYVIALLNVVFTIMINVYGTFSLAHVLMQVAVSTALCLGISWLRWLFLLGTSLGIMITLALSFTDPTLSIWFNNFLLLNLAEVGISAVLLIFNRSVGMYFRKERKPKQ